MSTNAAYVTEAGPSPSGFTAKTAAVLGLLVGTGMLLGAAIGALRWAAGDLKNTDSDLVFALLVLMVGLGGLIWFGAIVLLKRHSYGAVILATVSILIAVEALAEFISGAVTTSVGRLIAAVLVAVLALLPSTFHWYRWKPWGGWTEKNSARG